MLFLSVKEQSVPSATTQGHVQGLRQYPLVPAHFSCNDWKTATPFTHAVSTTTAPF